jgi:dienelactone hydrolase
MDQLMAPSSWFTMFTYKPIWAIQLMYHFIPWMRRNGRGAAKDIVTSFFRSLRASEPTSALKIGAAGFCWGGQYTVGLAHSSKGEENLIDCAFTAHPSFLVMPSAIEDVKLPLSIAVGDNDNQLKGPQAILAKDILEKKDGDHEVVIMPGAKHGFAIRTNPEDKQQMEFAERAEVQALDWFRKWLV